MGSNKFIRRILVPLATLVTVIVNLSIDAIRPNGLTTAQISDSFPNFFVPAGYVFAIWGIIYIGLIAFTIYQALDKQLDNPRLQAITPLYLLSCVFNIAWLFSFQFGQFGLSMVMMIGLLLCLIGCYLRLGTGRPGTGRTQVSNSERWFARVPISIYLGWITVATIANATQFLVFLKWNGFGIAQQTWAVIMIAVAVVVALLMLLRHRDVAYLLVLVWAIAGIGMKQAAVPAVSTPAWIATAIVAIFAIAALVMRRPAGDSNTQLSG